MANKNSLITAKQQHMYLCKPLTTKRLSYISHMGILVTMLQPHKVGARLSQGHGIAKCSQFYRVVIN